MKSIRSAMRFLVLAGIAGAFFASRVEATPIISVSPSTQNATVGDSVAVDILVSGIDPGTAVGGVSFDLSFNSAILQGVSFSLDPDFKMSDALDPILDLSGGFTGGSNSPLDVFFTAGLDPAVLPGLQGTGFRVATVKFDAVGAGLSALNLSVVPVGGIFLSGADGTTDLGAVAVNGSVCVTTPVITSVDTAAPNDPCAVAAVPEPATFGLLATGLAALARRRRKNQK